MCKMYSLCAVALLLCYISAQCTSVNASKLIEHTAASLKEASLSGTTTFIYFGQKVTPAIKAFIEQLEMSAHALEDYGIAVGKVNCSGVSVEKYCTEGVLKKVYLFRGAEVLRSFDVDTVFDVNAIVSHVLFTVLFNEVRYVHSPAELLSVEKAVRGKRDVVMGHIPVLGLPEHRALMEAAFVYGAKYQFVQTTGAPLLRHMGVSDPVSAEARLWFLRCSSVTRPSEPCPHTLLRKPLTTINIHTFLQMMEAPLLTVAAVDPDEVQVVYNHLNVPLLYLFSRSETLQLDTRTAESLAWTLRGDVGVVLINRDSPRVKTPEKYNAAYRLPQEEVRYLTLKNVQEVVNLFREKLFQQEEDEEEEEDEDQDDRWPVFDVLDDEVAESVYRDRGVMLDTETVTELTDDTFSAALTQNDLMVVLFYVKWDAVSMAFLQSYAEVADALEDVSGVVLSSVDCGEWTVVCSGQNISSFPSVLLYRPGERPQRYRGMLGNESLHRFLLLSLVSSPVFLSSSAEVLSFLEGDLYKKHSSLSSVRVLGLYTPADTDVVVFEEAAKSLRGETLLGLFVHQEAERWAEELSVMLPALVVSRGPELEREAHSLRSSTVEELTSLVHRATLDTFPELTVESLPLYLELKKPLLLLFLGTDESPESVQSMKEIKKAQGTGKLDTALPCYIHLGRTPAGRSVLESYLGFVPSLPALVLSQLTSGGKVFYFPPERPLLAEDIIRWLQRIEQGQEQPAGVISDEAWGPPVPFYDFLAAMDEESPGYAAQRSHKSIKPEVRSGQRGSERNPSGRGDTETASNSPRPPHTEL